MKLFFPIMCSVFALGRCDLIGYNRQQNIALRHLLNMQAEDFKAFKQKIAEYLNKQRILEKQQNRNARYHRFHSSY